jgi:hypothetical protein
MTSLKNKISTISSNQNAPPTYYIKGCPLSMGILHTLMPQGVEVSIFEK